MSGSRPPVFDGPRFGRTLRNYMDSRKLGVGETAKRAGISYTTLQQLRAGVPTGGARRKGQQALHPSITKLAGLAWALDLRLSFVLSWGGITDEGDRFTQAERRVLGELLECEPGDVDEHLRARARTASSKETVS